MAVAMATLMARLRSQSGRPSLPELARRSLVPLWISQQSYATRSSMSAKSRGAWEVSHYLSLFVSSFFSTASFSLLEFFGVIRGMVSNKTE